MNNQLISRLIEKHNFYFQCWNDRYGLGVWAALGVYENQIDTVRDLSDAGDLDMIPAMEYVFSADWLPYVTAPTLGEAMQKLEARLTSILQEGLVNLGQWSTLVTDAINALSNATDGRTYYGDPMPEKLDNLPRTYDLAVAQATGVITTYVSDNVHGGVRAGDKDDNALLMALARKITASKKNPQSPS